MAGYVSGKPSINIRDFFNKDRDGVVFPLNQERYYFFFSARYALRAGIAALGIGRGDAILLPSYNCGVEIDPVINLGIDPVFYKIRRNLFVDFDDLLEKITGRVRAVLVTHFLGFPQPIDEIKEICNRKRVYLIEDCAHALLSTYNGKPLGSFGDVSVFSLLKTLPVPNGGVLAINNTKINHSHRPEKPNFLPVFFYTAELLKYRTNNNSIKDDGLGMLHNAIYPFLSFIQLALAGYRKYLNPTGLYLVRPDSYFFVDRLQSWGISDLSLKQIGRTDFEKVKHIRRHNFEYLLNHFRRNTENILLFRELPEGVCPLFFPTIVGSSEERSALYEALKRRGVITHPWWDRFHQAVPWSEFPEAVDLKERLFGLPIHQDLGPEHLDRMIEEFEKAYESATR